MADRQPARALANVAVPTTIISSEGITHQLESEEVFSDIMSSTVVGQTPRSWGMCDLRESAIKGPGPPVRRESPSSGLSGEGDGGTVTLSISPGTHATPSTMRAKLALLQSATKANQGSLAKKRSTKRIDFEATAAAFLQQDENVGDEENFARPRASDIGHDKENDNENVEYAVQRETLRPLDDCNIVTDNRTFIVPAAPPEKKALDKPNVPASPVFEDLERQQRSALTAWLNHILKSNLINDTVTSNAESYMKKSHAEANRHLREILAAVKTSTTVSVPTKEQFSLRVYAEERNLNVLRIRARQLFEGSPVPNEIARIVNEEKIQVRPDREVYADVGIKVDLLLMLLNFHPLWLRLGLETVFGEAIPLHPETFTVGLTTFIAQRLFTDPFLLQKRNVAHQTVKSLVTKDGGIVLLRHFLTKLCQFLFFVETANQRKLIPQSPCLFLRNSTIKSTEEVLSKISRDLISGSGNLPKMLTRIGYKATYKQGFFEEYHFVVHTLTDGLTDGIVLAKIVELLTDQPDKIMSRLRNPMNDRLRKVNNVETVLTAARAAGIETGDVKADMIVAGHKEATLELVWRLVGVYMVVQAEGGTASQVRRASLTLENWSTRRLSAIKTPMDVEEERITRGVVRVQALIRGFFARRYVVQLKMARIEAEKRAQQSAKAATVIQSAVRAMLARQQLKRLKEQERLRLLQLEADRLAELQRRIHAAIVLQSALRGMWARRELKRLRAAKLEADRLIEEQRQLRAAIVIQTAARSMLARRELSRLIEEVRRLRAALRIQTAVRGMFARKELERLREAKAETDRLIEEHRRLRAAICIQCAVRAFLARRELGRLKKAKELKLLQEEADRLAEQQRLAAIVLQSMVRGVHARRELKRRREAKLEADRLIEEQRRLRAAICIQVAVRVMAARRELMKRKAAKLEADRLIEEQRRQRAALRLQAAARGMFARHELQHLKELKRLRLLQEEADRLAAQQRLIAAVIVLQSALRGTCARRELKRLREAKLEADRLLEEQRRLRAAITAVRGMLARWELRRLIEEHLRLRAAIVIQSGLRGMLARRELHRLIEEQRRLRATIILQSALRGMLARRELRRLIEEHRRLRAAICIQTAVRCMFARRVLQRLRAAKAESDRLIEEQRRLRAAIRIQTAVRCMFARRTLKQLKELRRIKLLEEEAARLAERQRRTYAAIILQSALRGLWARRELDRLRLAKAEADRLLAEQRRVRAAIFIQTSVRCMLARRELKLLKAAKLERDRLIEEQRRLRATVRIQSVVRSVLARRQLEQLKELKRLRLLEEEARRLAEERRMAQAAVILQSAVRGVLARVELKRLRTAKIEAERIAEEQRRSRSAVRIQAWLRGIRCRQEMAAVREEVQERMALWQLAVETEEARTRPIIDRVRDFLPDLLSDSLYRRKKAAYFLERATHWSSQCCLYVVANQGVAIVFDCLDELNRGEGSAEVVLPLMLLLVTLTKCRLITNEMIAERKVLIERGLHYWHAFHNKPDVNVLCAQILINLTKLTDIKQLFVQYKGPWYVDQLKKKFIRLPKTDPRVTSMSQLVGIVQRP